MVLVDVFLHPAKWHDHDTDFVKWLHPPIIQCGTGSGIVAVNSPNGSQLPAMWQVALGWHAIEFAQMSAILEFYVSRFHFDQITAVDMSFCTSLRHRRKLPPNSGGLKALSFPFPSLSLSLEVGPLNPARGLGERCKLPQRGLGRSPSRNRIWCILALKSVIWWQQF